MSRKGLFIGYSLFVENLIKVFFGVWLAQYLFDLMDTTDFAKSREGEDN